MIHIANIEKRILLNKILVSRMIVSFLFIQYAYYDNSDLNPRCDLLNMICFWDFPDHFLYINLPWKIFLKKVIQFLDLTKKIVLFWWRVFRQAPTSAILSTNKFSQIFKSISKCWNTCFGNYFMKNGNIKCYSALNSGQLSITSFFCSTLRCYHNAQGIHKGKMKVALYEKNYMGFLFT